MMNAEFARRFVLVVDIAGYSRRSDSGQAVLRRAVSDLLRRAVDRLGLTEGEVAVSDRGDGLLLLLPDSVPANRLSVDLIGWLDAGLAEYADAAGGPSGGLQLRVALHQALVHLTDDGAHGSGVTLALRLADAPPLREALRAPGARLGVIVSDEVYRRTVATSYGGASQAPYRRVGLTQKETDVRAWLWVPGHPVSPEDAEDRARYPTTSGGGSAFPPWPERADADGASPRDWAGPGGPPIGATPPGPDFDDD